MAARKFLILLCSVFALINISPQFPWNSAFAAEQKSIEPDLAKIGDSKVWKLVGLEATTAEKGGKRLANLKTLPDENGSTDHISMALLSGVEFNTGTIELDLRGRGDTLRCFLGVCFHVEDEKTHEAVYFRPFNFKAKDDVARSHGVQYISLPDHTWERLRKEHEGVYENAVKPTPDPEGWFHAKIEVTEKKVRVWVDVAAEPTLTIDRLSKRQKGSIGLWTTVREGDFANLKITPDTK